MIVQFAKILIVTILGIALGWLIRAQTTSESITEEDKTATVDVKRFESKSSNINFIDSSGKQALKLNKDAISKADEKTNIVTLAPSVDSIILYLTQNNRRQEDQVKVRDEIRTLLKESPELVFELLETLVDLEDEGVRHQLTLTLWTLNSRESKLMEPWMMERIEAGDRAADWLKLLGRWGLKSRNGLETVLGQLANNPDPHVISASINALNNTLNTEPLAMSPNQKKEISNQLRKFLNSDNDDLRAEVVESLANFPQNDSQQIIISALNDRSPKVRERARWSYMRDPFDSADIQTVAMSHLQDSSFDILERASIARFALTLPLPAHEKSIAQDVQQGAQDYFNGLTEEQLRALDKGIY